MTTRGKYRIRSETKTVSEILHQGRFVVPWHQREYDWGDGEVKSFWEDINMAQEREASDYFVGSIVLTDRGGETYDIQDGQQRLVTFSLMCAAIGTFFEAQNNPSTDIRIQEVRKVLFNVPPVGMLSQAQVDNADERITMSEKDKFNYGLILRGHDLEPNGKLKRACQFLRRQVRRLREEKAHSLLEYLTRRVIAVEIISGTGNATEVFETLNDRGKHLENVDLVRNYLYSHFGPDFDNRHRQVHENLLALRDQFGGQHAIKKMADYVRCYMQCRYGYINSKQMHKGIREAVDEDVQSLDTDQRKQYVHDLTRDLRRAEHIQTFLALDAGDINAEVVKQFVTQSGSLQHHRNMEDFILELRGYGVTRPVMFAILLQFQRAAPTHKRMVAQQGNAIARDLTSYVMRTATVVDKFAPSTLEAEFSNWGHRIHRELTPSTQGEFSAALTKIDRAAICSDPGFQAAVSNLRVTPQKAKRILLSLYRFQQNDLSQQNPSRLSVEHILPESPFWLEGWSGFSEDTHTSHYSKLGNLTLLALAENRGGEEQNESFEKKSSVLSRSTIAENQEISSLDAWTPQRIQERQERLAQLACHVWPIAK